MGYIKYLFMGPFLVAVYKVLGFGVPSRGPKAP